YKGVFADSPQSIFEKQTTVGDAAIKHDCPPIGRPYGRSRDNVRPIRKPAGSTALYVHQPQIGTPAPGTTRRDAAPVGRKPESPVLAWFANRPQSLPAAVHPSELSRCVGGAVQKLAAV